MLFFLFFVKNLSKYQYIRIYVSIYIRLIQIEIKTIDFHNNLCKFPLCNSKTDIK